MIPGVPVRRMALTDSAGRLVGGITLPPTANTPDVIVWNRNVYQLTREPPAFAGWSEVYRQVFAWWAE